MNELLIDGRTMRQSDGRALTEKIHEEYVMLFGYKNGTPQK